MLCLCSTNNLIYPQKEQLTSCMEQAILSDRKDFLNIFLKEVYYGLLFMTLYFLVFKEEKKKKETT